MYACGQCRCRGYILLLLTKLSLWYGCSGNILTPIDGCIVIVASLTLRLVSDDNADTATLSAIHALVGRRYPVITQGVAMTGAHAKGEKLTACPGVNPRPAAVVHPCLVRYCRRQSTSRLAWVPTRNGHAQTSTRSGSSAVQHAPTEEERERERDCHPTLNKCRLIRTHLAVEETIDERYEETLERGKKVR